MIKLQLIRSIDKRGNKYKEQIVFIFIFNQYTRETNDPTELSFRFY